MPLDPELIPIDSGSAAASIDSVEERFALAVRALQGLARDVATDAVLVPREDLPSDRVASMLAAIRDNSQFAVAINVEGPEHGKRTTLRAADSEMTELVRMLQTIAAEDPTAGPLSRRSRAEQAQSPSPAARRSAGIVPLSEAAPEQHQQFVREYRDIVKASMEQRAYRVTRDVKRPLIAMAGQLAQLQADPRDCVQIQSDVIEGFAETEVSGAVDVAQDEATLLLIELVGYLARAYRDRGAAGPSL